MLFRKCKFTVLFHIVLTDCKTTPTALDYAGDLNSAKSGATCVRWDTAIVAFDPEQFPDANLVDAANFCRNPDRKPDGVWCFTDSDNGQWEYCDLPLCTGIYLVQKWYFIIFLE